MNSILKYFMLFPVAATLATSGYSAEIERPAPGEILVSSDPADAIVSCDTVVKGPAPVTVQDVTPGEHLITVSKAGFTDARKTVSVGPREKVPVNLKLERLTGLVLVHSDPQGASIEINGAAYGKTPALLTELPFGDYRMKLNIAGFQPKEVDLQIKDRTPMKKFYDLTTSSATLTVESEPAGARLSVNGIARGTTPATVDRIPEGEVIIDLSMDGFNPAQRSLKLVSSQKETVKVVLSALKSELKVVSMPAKARIYLDNQNVGESPVELKDLAAGTYKVRAELRGYEILSRSVTIAAGQKTTEEFRLTKNSGTIELTTEPSDVKVFLDGEDVGITKVKADESDKISEPMTIDTVTTGNHQLQLTRKGFVSKSVSVTVEKDKTATVHQALERRFIPNCELRISGGTTVTGVLLDVDPDGGVRLEVKPGIFKSFRKGEIKSRRPLRDISEDQVESAPARTNAPARADK